MSRKYVKLEEPVVCPVCGMDWTVQTPHSWWLTYDRCYACMPPGPGEREYRR